MRVFFALPVPSAAELVLAQQAERLKHDFPGLKTVKREGLHITLSFFGEVNEQELEDLRGRMTDRLLVRAPIIASLTNLGQFPTRGNPKIIFCSLGQGAEEVVEFARVFRRVVGNNQEKRFLPHITLARNKRERLPDGYIRSLPPCKVEFCFDRLVLFQSILKRDGAEYNPLATLVFQKGCSHEGS